MVLQTRYYIELPDILTLQIECNKCGAIATRKIGQQFNTLPNSCGNCQETFMSPNRFDQDSIQKLMESITAANRVLKGAPFTLRFEVQAPKSNPQRSEDQQ
jgi:hypothetical protein